MNHTEQFDFYRARVEEKLSSLLNETPSFRPLLEGMRYSLLAGGKRIRPVLTLASCELCGGKWEDAIGFACAVELIHTYSLIHDDLPCMDDDDLRRGKPSNHKVYGEANALLAGDALQAFAFETAITMTPTRIPTGRVAECIRLLARAAGPFGMAGGQYLDLAGEGTRLAPEKLAEITALKTGALITAACEIGAVLAGGDSPSRDAVRTFGACVGFAFQVWDDLLDAEGNEKALGKPVGSDAAGGKTTFYTLWGRPGCEGAVRSATEGGMAALARFENSEFLRWLAGHLAGREG